MVLAGKLMRSIQTTAATATAKAITATRNAMQAFAEATTPDEGDVFGSLMRPAFGLWYWPRV